MSRIVLLGVTIIVSMFTQHVSAGSGKGIIPYWASNHISTSQYHRIDLYISNITDNDLDVTVTFYDQDGNKLTNGVSYVNFSNSNTEIEAGKSGYVKVETNGWKHGYGVIEWSNNGTDDDVAGLVGVLTFRQYNSDIGYRSHAVSINNGAPF